MDAEGVGDDGCRCLKYELVQGRDPCFPHWEAESAQSQM
jgi:hypothetical protein